MPKAERKKNTKEGGHVFFAKKTHGLQQEIMQVEWHRSTEESKGRGNDHIIKIYYLEPLQLPKKKYY